MKNEYLTVRISEQEKELFKTLAESKSLSMSEYILYLVRRELEKSKNDK